MGLSARWSLLIVALAAGLTGAVIAVRLYLSRNQAGGFIPAFEVVWLFEPPERGAIVSSPLVAGDHVYVGAIRDRGLVPHGAVYCLDRRTGKVLWTFDNHGRMIHLFSSPCLAEGRLYIGEGMHENNACNLYCLDAETGKELWHFMTGSHVESTPRVVDGRVFFGAGEDGVYCLDAATGKRLWQHDGPIHVDTNPFVAGPWLYAGSGGSHEHKNTEVFCLGVADGRERWRRLTDLPVWGSPTLDGELLFVGLGNGRLAELPLPPEKPAGGLLCLAAQSGQVKWSFTQSDAVFTQPWVEGRRVYFGSRDGHCYAVDRASGDLLWAGRVGSPVVARPQLVDGTLYVAASGGRVYCLEPADGTPRRPAFDLAAVTGGTPRLFSTPAVVPDRERGQGHHCIFIGAEVNNSVSSAAVLYCVRD